MKAVASALGGVSALSQEDRSSVRWSLVHGFPPTAKMASRIAPATNKSSFATRLGATVVARYTRRSL